MYFSIYQILFIRVKIDFILQKIHIDIHVHTNTNGKLLLVQLFAFILN